MGNKKISAYVTEDGERFGNFALIAYAHLIGAGNNPMVGMTVAVAVAIEEACK